MNEGPDPVITVELDVLGTVGTDVPKEVEILLPAPSSNLTSAPLWNAKCPTSSSTNW